MRLYLFIFFFVMCFQSRSYAQIESTFNCRFLSEIFNYIKYDHKERVIAFDQIGGVLEYSFGKKGIRFKNTSHLPDSTFNLLVSKYDLLNFRDEPLVKENYTSNIIVDTMGFFPSSCECLKRESDSTKYEVSNKWITNKNIPENIQLIRLSLVSIDKNMLVLVLNSNRSIYYFGYFYFEIDGNINPVLKKIKWGQPDYDIDNK